MQLASEFELEGDEELEHEEERRACLGAGEFGEEELETEWPAKLSWSWSWNWRTAKSFSVACARSAVDCSVWPNRCRGAQSLRPSHRWSARRSADPSAACWVRQRRHCSSEYGEYGEYGEYEDEFEEESEHEEEFFASLPVNPSAEFMAAVASEARTDAEAEAMTGAATLLAISPADRRELRRVLPYMVRGTAVLTRVLRSRRDTRPAVRVVPEIVRRTSTTLARRSAAGQPVTRKAAARVMATQTRRVLGNPRTCVRAIKTNARAAQTARRTSAGPTRTRVR